MLSPFFHPPATATADSLAILHLKRDSQLPLTLRTAADDGYAEGAVTNTRFGSFPHSTIIGAPWGSQIRASKVDTGTRGRKGKHAKHDTSVPPDATTADDSRKRKPDEPASESEPAAKVRKTDVDSDAPARVVPIEAGSGFVHVLQPTPETWTASLDHRTQVVYVPDYSYILQRLRVRPGDALIEAGAGSGSFTHAAARAVFDGYPTDSSDPHAHGRVFSYEFHEPRVHTLRAELVEHGLDRMVTLTHRDVCNDGFSLPDRPASPNVKAIFLDLPAPWLALKHLTRDAPHTPLHPSQAIHLCTFSPCIEQVMATVSALRRAGWLDITMVEVANRRLDVRRERVGLAEEGLRGVNATAASVAESLARLREVELKLTAFNAARPAEQKDANGQRISSKQARLERNRRDAVDRKLYLAGNVVHRTEPEVKTHTSYLVFAVLPRVWTDEDEARCRARWDIAKEAGAEK